MSNENLDFATALAHICPAFPAQKSPLGKMCRSKAPPEMSRVTIRECDYCSSADEDVCAISQTSRGKYVPCTNDWLQNWKAYKRSEKLLLDPRWPQRRLYKAAPAVRSHCFSANLASPPPPRGRVLHHVLHALWAGCGPQHQGQHLHAVKRGRQLCWWCAA